VTDKNMMSHDYLVTRNKIFAVYTRAVLKLTPQQIATIAKLSEQTLRHWRCVLPPLTGLNGYTPCFSPGDALALLVVRHLVKIMGISVGALAPASSGLFDLCRNTSWPHLADCQLVIEVERGAVSLLAKVPNLNEPAIVVPMRRFAEELQAAWATSNPTQNQLPLQLSAAVASRATRYAR
jgi:hypothetical protein